ncbi:MAG: HU family DNA-binding protein [Candidatus Binatia bacterium]
MGKAMTKSQLADHLARKADVAKKTANQILDDLASLAYKEAKNTFILPGLGRLVVGNRKARVGRNPRTGEPINIPARRVIKFRIAKAAKSAILGPGGHRRPGTG